MSTQHAPTPADRIPFEMPRELDCPSCGAATEALKEFEVIETLFFALFYAKWQSVTATACPHCMRTYLLKRLGINLFSANLVWPIFILPIYLYCLVDTYLPGHSASVEQEYYEAYLLAMRRAAWAQEDAEIAEDA